MIRSIFCLQEDGPITGWWGLISQWLARGRPAGHLQAWPRIWTQDYRQQFQLVFRVRLELEATKLQVQCSKPLGHTVSLTINSNDMKTSRIFQKVKWERSSQILLSLNNHKKIHIFCCEGEFMGWSSVRVFVQSKAGYIWENNSSLPFTIRSSMIIFCNFLIS